MAKPGGRERGERKGKAKEKVRCMCNSTTVTF